MASWLSTKKIDWALVVILVVAFIFRFLYLGMKPPHFDEGINGWFVDQLISNGYYSYDPTNYHGPFHFYVLWVFKFFFGRNLWALRLSASCFGLAGIYLITELKPYVGKMTAYGAALFCSVSPGIVFYTRYAIHESELFFFSLLGIIGFLRYGTVKDKTSLWLIGLGVTGMVITKETFVVHLACFVIAWFCLKIVESVFKSSEPVKYVHPKFTEPDVLIVISVCLFLFIAFYSGFFLHFRGVADFFRSFQAWIGTAQKGNGHQKPPWYWVDLFQRYELVATIGLVASLRLFFPSSRGLRLIGIYGVGVLLAYSLVSYKTPWCVLNIVWPFYLVVAGIIAEVGARNRSYWAGAMAAFVVLSIPGAAKSVDLNFHKYEDESEPYVYVQTFSDIMRVHEKLMHIVEKDPSKYSMSIKLFMDSNWPIPWLFGDFTKAVYYGAPNGVDPSADLILIDEKYKTLIESRLLGTYFTLTFRLRSAQERVVAYFEEKLFKDEFPADFPKFIPKPLEPVVPGAGLLAEYFQNSTWTGLPLFKKMLPLPNFNMTDNQRPLPAPFGILFSGEIYVPESGSRVFYLSSDDGSDLYIDGKQVIENLGAHPDQMRSGLIDLKKGWHPILIHYNDFGGGMVLRLWWNNASGFQEDINPKYFRFRSPEGRG